ncbi:hypothetical protein [Nocardia goodfellowii]|uniref:Uncharacterized protein n=1 Tax=Nocardia goodfellowii TaxID=882446 RepID=A0ABS4QMN8_9NOCA|nr:hypothetical protein [Nocardia goodfellowii]MBP2192976.1 hypothetical protein [Nocardia goodfellowii]
MTAMVLDAMDDVTAWRALAADGVSGSAELAMTSDPGHAGWGTDGVSARITASPEAAGHRFQRGIAATDISAFGELRLSLAVTTAPPGDFLLEVQLASAAVGFDHAANTWRRLIPVERRSGWTVVAMSLADLPATIASGVDGLRLRCVAGPFAIHLDDLAAVLPRPLADADAALLTCLGSVRIGNTAVPVAIRTPAQPIPSPPAIDIEQFDIRRAAAREVDRPVRRDFTPGGYREFRAGTPLDIDYAVRVIAADRATQAQLLETVLSRLPAAGALSIEGESASLELLGAPDGDRIGGAPVLRYRIGVRTPPVALAAAVPVQRVDLVGDLLDISA